MVNLLHLIKYVISISILLTDIFIYHNYFDLFTFCPRHHTYMKLCWMNRHKRGSRFMLGFISLVIPMICLHGPLTRYVAGLCTRRECQERFPRHRRWAIPTCITARARLHVPWRIPGSLTSGFLWSRCEENVPGIPGACATRNFICPVRVPLGSIT